jgi:hypothetical protein
MVFVVFFEKSGKNFFITVVGTIAPWPLGMKKVMLS